MLFVVRGVETDINAFIDNSEIIVTNRMCPELNSVSKCLLVTFSIQIKLKTRYIVSCVFH